MLDSAESMERSAGSMMGTSPSITETAVRLWQNAQSIARLALPVA